MCQRFGLPELLAKLSRPLLSLAFLSPRPLDMVLKQSDPFLQHPVLRRSNILLRATHHFSSLTAHTLKHCMLLFRDTLNLQTPIVRQTELQSKLCCLRELSLTTSVLLLNLLS
jgi:hypothetical protein